jgi:hypothetical protein
MPTVDLAALDEAGFAALYARDIEPLYQQAEVERRAAVSTFRQRLWIVVPVAAAAAAAAVVFTRELMPTLFAVALVGVLGSSWAFGPLAALGVRLKDETLQRIAAAIGATYRMKEHPADTAQRCLQLGLLPRHSRSAYEDWFHGERHGCGFDLFEGHLENRVRTRNGTSYVTVFRGQIVRIAFPKAFNGVTIVRRDAGVFNDMSNWGTQLERVGFADPQFERTFEVVSNDQIEARYLVHPMFAQRLLELEAQLKGGKVRCAFEGGDLLIAVEGGNQFEIRDLFKPLDNPEQARRIVDDLAAVTRVMDAVLTAEQAPLLRPRA